LGHVGQDSRSPGRTGGLGFLLAVDHLGTREIYRAMMAAVLAAVLRVGDKIVLTDLPREVPQSANGGSPSPDGLH